MRTAAHLGRLDPVAASFLARGQRRDGRLFLLLAFVCYFGALLVASLVADFDLWRYFGVLNIEGPFEDMRVITSGWECTRKGFDVLAENPCDPFGRETNYPRVWMTLAPLGLGQESTVVLALAAWAGFFVAVLLLVGRLTAGEAAVYAGALLSPSVMNGVASGNNDLVIFAIVVLALAAFRARRALVRVGSYALFLLAAVLKLYPLFAWTVLLRQERRRAAAALAATALPMTVYLVATFDDLRLISEATPRPILIAYGARVFVDGTTERLVDPFPALEILTQPLVRTAAAALGLTIALALSVLLAGRLPTAGVAGPAPSQRHLDAFWAGASIFLGTFAVGYNWDYRLVFLLLTMPQLVRWTKDAGPLASISAWGLAAVIGTMWLSRLPFIFPLDEVVNWALFIVFAALLLATLPPWLGSVPAFRAPSRRGVSTRATPPATSIPSENRRRRSPRESPDLSAEAE